MKIFINIALFYLFLVSVSSRGGVSRRDAWCPCAKLRAAELRGYEIDARACLRWCRERSKKTKTLTRNEVQEKATTTAVVEDQTEEIFCIDEKNGKRHTADSQWQDECDIFKCHSNSSITRHKMECPKRCAPPTDRKSKCCRVCKRSVHCNPNEIRLEIPKEMLHRRDLNRIFLTDLKCRPSRNDSHVVFRTGLTSCGTKFEKTHLGLRYSNVVVRSLLSNIIIRPLFRFSCYFRVINPDVDSPKAGQIKVRRPDENINFVMVYTDELGNIIKGNPMQTEAIEGKPVFLRISTDRRLKRDRFLVVEKCDIISLNRRKSYSLINEGCPTEPSLKVLVKSAEKFWFTFQARLLAKTNYQHKDWFSYQGKRFHPNDREYVDLTCQAAVCTTSSKASLCNRHCGA
ncbi:uncharacterized protein LOC135684795 [Rhopilema esculentum]|uniref:uncharacterized protein LOC135684795 n=1 Tax=Rhopilema esculentum TaxID=499914 RepID=UPI0031D8DA37